jgi:hypothetical protein
MQSILFTTPGKASIAALAPSIEICWHPDARLGRRGWTTVPGGRQHLNPDGPGQEPDSVIPDSQSVVKRQFPKSSVPQTVLVQHRTSAGVPGQAPEIEVPPPLAHLEVEIHTPGAPPSPVQGSLRARGPRTTSPARAVENSSTSVGKSTIFAVVTLHLK